MRRLRPPRTPLSVLRIELSGARDEVDLDALLRRLDGDDRAGARARVGRGRARLERDRLERERLRGLLAYRDALEARGVRGIAGVDEVGVGPLAGPVVAAAVVLPERPSLVGLDDSKRLAPARRETLAAEIHGSALGVGVAEVGVETIDQIGIYQASLEAMRRAVASLSQVVELGHLLVDARTVPGVSFPQTSIVKGDSKDASIAAASIVAKVHRDALMQKLGRRHPGYGFDRHMGYGTPDHLAALARLGPCPIHRRSFAPVERAARGLAQASRARA
jgi:ribonuclease HII